MAVNEDLFPELSKEGYTITSDPDPGYNCIAWAAGFNDRFMDPADGYDWPSDLPKNHELDTLVMLYEGLGYDLCDDGNFEPEYEKVAIYGIGGEYEHATRQLANGAWTSKLGLDDDIEHPRAESLAGDHYGPVVHYLKRRVLVG
ncbi:MAG: hypothetical protein WD229_13720 [Pirellulales bacterium]